MSPFSKKDSSKCVSLVEVTQKRIDILKKKRAIIVKQSRDDVAKLLERGQDANAASRAEHVFREENIVGAYELLEQYCSLVIKDIRAIKSAKECSLELKEAMAGLVYAAPRCGDLQELSKIRELFASRFGVEYISSILELQPGCDVNKKIIQKLSSSPPNPDVRLKLLKGIALEYKIDWNYQKAVEISFNSGETSQGKSKIPTNASLAPKGLADASSLSNHVGIKTKEPNVSSSDPSEKTKSKSPSAMSETSTRSTGDNGYASLAEHKSKPSIVHDIRPRERDIVGVNRVLPGSSSSTVDKSMDQDKPKDTAGLHSSSAMHKAEHKKKGSISAASASASDRQNLSAPFKSSMSQDNDLRGRAKSEVNEVNYNASVAQVFNEAPPPSSNELRGTRALLKVNPASTGSDEVYDLTKESSASHPSDANRTSQSRPKLSTSNLAQTSVSVSRAELGGAKSAASTASTRQTKLPHKPEHYGIAKHHHDSSGVSIAEHKYVGEYQNPVRASAVKADEESGGKSIPHIKFQSNKANPNYVEASISKQDEESRGKNTSDDKYQSYEGVVDPYSHNVIEAHRSMPVEKNFESYRNGHHPAQYLKNSVQPSNREVESRLRKDHTVDQRNGERRMLEGSGIIEKSLRGTEEPATYNKHVGPKTRRFVLPCELTEAEMDQELADLAITVGSAARAANAALEMVQNTASTRSKTDKKNLRQGLHSGMHHGSGNPKANLESRKDSYHTVRQKNNMVNDDLYTNGPEYSRVAHKEPYQEQESVSFDSEMPYFDDSSDNSSQDSPTERSSSRLPLFKENGAYKDFKRPPNTNINFSANNFGVKDRNNQFRENLIISKKEDFQTERVFDDYWAQSGGSVSPDSSSGSHQNWGADVSFGIEHGRVSNREIANENNGMGVLRWHGSSEDGLDKKKWGIGDIQPLSKPHKQHDVATKTNAGKLQGRSVRSSRPS